MKALLLGTPRLRERVRVIKGVSFYSNCAAESVGGITRYFGAIN